MKKVYIILGILCVIIVVGWIWWNNANTSTEMSEVTQPLEQEASSVSFIHYEDEEQGVSFDMPEDWKDRYEPMSGRPAIASPDFYLRINQGDDGAVTTAKGALISYYRYAPPEGSEYVGKTAEYLAFLIKNSSGPGYGEWSKTTLDGREAYIHTTGGPYDLQLLMKDGEYIVEIRSSDHESGKYKFAFDRFIKTFKIVD